MFIFTGPWNDQRYSQVAMSSDGVSKEEPSILTTQKSTVLELTQNFTTILNSLTPASLPSQSRMKSVRPFLIMLQKERQVPSYNLVDASGTCA